MVIETFDRLRSGLNSFHGELLLVDHHTKVVSTCKDRRIRGREPGGVHETLMIAKHEMCIDFYGASEKWI